MRKLLAQGRTDLLREFVSNRTRRKFAAYLIRKADGTIGFEFEPRPVRAAKAGAKPPASADALASAASSPRKRAAKTPATIASAPAAPAKEPVAVSRRTSARRDGDQPQTSPTARKAPARKVAATKAASPKAGAVKAAIRKTARRSVKTAARHKS
jgi:DNA topoisomerase-3